MFILQFLRVLVYYTGTVLKVVLKNGLLARVLRCTLCPCQWRCGGGILEGSQTTDSVNFHQHNTHPENFTGTIPNRILPPTIGSLHEAQKVKFNECAGALCTTTKLIAPVHDQPSTFACLPEHGCVSWLFALVKPRSYTQGQFPPEQFKIFWWTGTDIQMWGPEPEPMWRTLQHSWGS